jgi:hypothetical protein
MKKTREADPGWNGTNRDRDMCRNIKTLFNFEPPATDEEIQAAALQFVRKLSGFNKPSQANERAFTQAVSAVTAVARTLVDSLSTTAQPRNRETEYAKARERSRRRFGPEGRPSQTAKKTASRLVRSRTKRV